MFRLCLMVRAVIYSGPNIGQVGLVFGAKRQVASAAFADGKIATEVSGLTAELTGD